MDNVKVKATLFTHKCVFMSGRFDPKGSKLPAVYTPSVVVNEMS